MPCEYCGKMYQKKSLNRHKIDLHADEFRYQCPKCYTGFLDEKKQIKHSENCKTHVYECYLCNMKITRDISKLRKHMSLKHMNDRPFSCKFTDCNSTFKVRPILLRHERDCSKNSTKIIVKKN